MASLSDYFNKTGYKHTYDIGDRVFGHYNKIPFVGTVGNDRSKVGGDPNPEVTIHLDLPMQLPDRVTMFLIVKHKQIKRLVSMDDESVTIKKAKKIK